MQVSSSLPSHRGGIFLSLPYSFRALIIPIPFTVRFNWLDGKLYTFILLSVQPYSFYLMYYSFFHSLIHLFILSFVHPFTCRRIHPPYPLYVQSATQNHSNHLSIHLSFNSATCVTIHPFYNLSISPPLPVHSSFHPTYHPSFSLYLRSRPWNSTSQSALPHLW